MKLLRGLAFASALAALPAAAFLVPTDARASVSIAVSYENLVKDADAVGIVSPIDANAVWEDGRIVTYTHVRVDQPVAGDVATGGEAWIRTLGGVVGKIGQSVDGEPVFSPGKQALLFMRKFKAGGTWEVSARAQGQFPVVTDEITKKPKVVRSGAVGMLLPPKEVLGQGNQVAPQSAGDNASTPAAPAAPTVRLARDVLHDRAVDDVARDVAATWKKLHATPAK